MGGVAPAAGQDVPAGFKRSEVGLIPEDWLALPFDQLFRRLNGKNYQVLATDYQPYGQLPVIDQGQDLVAGWTDRLEKRFDCPTGGVVVFGDHTRVVKYVSVDFAVGADGTQLLVGRDPESTRFLAYQMQATEIPSAGYSRHFKFLTDSFFAAPSLVCERVEIAEALSDADALIESLQQLIAKKRAVRQGAMQMLLTGRQRLPGFSGKWKSKPLGELFRFNGGFSASRAQLGHDGHLYLHYGDIHGASSSLLDIDAKASRIPRIEIPLARVSRDSMLEDGDVVFVDASEDEEGVSKHVVVANPDGVPFIAGLHTIVAKGTGRELEHAYRRYCFLSEDVKQQFRFFAVGTKVQGVSKGNIGKIELRFPSSNEQTAIATVLSDMDAEIDALETQLAKTRDLKTGMMQALLAGRIRLPLDTAA